MQYAGTVIAGFHVSGQAGVVVGQQVDGRNHGPGRGHAVLDIDIDPVVGGIEHGQRGAVQALAVIEETHLDHAAGIAADQFAAAHGDVVVGAGRAQRSAGRHAVHARGQRDIVGQGHCRRQAGAIVWHFAGIEPGAPARHGADGADHGAGLAHPAVDVDAEDSARLAGRGGTVGNAAVVDEDQLAAVAAGHEEVVVVAGQGQQQLLAGGVLRDHAVEGAGADVAAQFVAVQAGCP